MNVSIISATVHEYTFPFMNTVVLAAAFNHVWWGIDSSCYKYKEKLT